MNKMKDLLLQQLELTKEMVITCKDSCLVFGKYNHQKTNALILAMDLDTILEKTDKLIYAAWHVVNWESLGQVSSFMKVVAAHLAESTSVSMAVRDIKVEGVYSAMSIDDMEKDSRDADEFNKKIRSISNRLVILTKEMACICAELNGD